jgi:inhibitor of cysteine peptidase
MIEIDGSADGTTHELAVGDQLVIWLPENPTTGYRWAGEAVDSRVISIDLGQFRRLAATTGGGGSRGITLTALAAGSVRVALKRWRAWEGDASVDRRFEIRVIVK